MIRPEMDFRKNIQLSITDLEKARKFAEDADGRIRDLAQKVFAGAEFSLDFEQKDNGNFGYSIKSGAFTAECELVVGWDMQLHDGQNVKFMALNFSGDGYNENFRASGKTLEKLPDYGYYGGMFAGGTAGFAASMIYAVYTEAMDATFYAVVMIIFGWLGSMIGKLIAAKIYNSRYDKVHVRAMDDKAFVAASAKWLTFDDEINQLMDQLLKMDKAQANSAD